MLSVIIQAKEGAERLPALISALTSAAVDGLVREVLIVGGGPPELLRALKDETGAELEGDLASAIARARSERLLLLPAAVRLRPDWTHLLARHLRDGGEGALLRGERPGLLRRGLFGLLIARTAAAGLAEPDLPRLRRKLGPRPARIG